MKKIQIKIDSEQEHEDHNDRFEVNTMILSDTGRINCEPSRTGCAKCIAQRIKQWHSANQ